MTMRKRLLVYTGMLVLIAGAAMAVHAALPEISLNSPTSFPVDI